MPAYKSLLKKTEWVLAGKKRKCYHHGDKRIAKGESCLVVAEDIGQKGYCGQCAAKMIAKARDDLDELERQKP